MASGERIKEPHACIKVVLAGRRVGKTQCIEVVKIVQEEIQAIIVSEKKMKGAERSPKGRAIFMK